jgi:hypothetical protein
LLSQTYNEDLRGYVKALLLNPQKHLILQSTDLIQDVHNL